MMRVAVSLTHPWISLSVSEHAIDPLVDTFLDLPEAAGNTLLARFAWFDVRTTDAHAPTSLDSRNAASGMTHAPAIQYIPQAQSVSQNWPSGRGESVNNT